MRCVRDGEGQQETIESPSETFMDTSTGLIWQRNGDSHKRSWELAEQYCRKLNYGNFSNWRLPEKLELKSILDYSRKSPAINSNNFPDTHGAYYWTTTVDSTNSGKYWRVNFRNATDGTGNTNNRYYVRCVVDEEIQQSQNIEETSSVETVIDTSTGLIWQKKPDGIERNWQNAKWYCEGLSLGGFSDWKLPGGRELKNVRRNKHIFDSYKITGKWDSSYWTANSSSSVSAYLVNFDSGNSIPYAKKNELNVRCVRGNSGTGTSSNYTKRISIAEYEAIIKASEDTAGCGILSFGCEDPLTLPPYDSGFHLKDYRRVKLYAKQYPWLGSEIELEQGDQVLVMASGKVTTDQRYAGQVNRPPGNALRMRIGESLNFIGFQGLQVTNGGYHTFTVQQQGEIQFLVEHWSTYPPKPEWYQSMHSGNYLLDVFVYDSAQIEGFQRFLRVMIQQNPEDTLFSAQARSFLR